MTTVAELSKSIEIDGRPRRSKRKRANDEQHRNRNKTRDAIEGAGLK